MSNSVSAVSLLAVAAGVTVAVSSDHTEIASESNEASTATNTEVSEASAPVNVDAPAAVVVVAPTPEQKPVDQTKIPTPTSPATGPLTVDDSEEERAMSAFKTLYSIFGHHKGDPLPANFGDCTLGGHFGPIAVKAINGLQRKAKLRREALFAGARKAVAERVENARKTGFAARAGIEALKATLPADAYNMLLASSPREVRIPLAELLPAFPTGTTVEQAQKELLALSYELVSAGKNKKDGHMLIVSLLAPTAMVKPPSVASKA